MINTINPEYTRQVLNTKYGTLTTNYSKITPVLFSFTYATAVAGTDDYNFISLNRPTTPYIWVGQWTTFTWYDTGVFKQDYYIYDPDNTQMKTIFYVTGNSLNANQSSFSPLLTWSRFQFSTLVTTPSNAAFQFLGFQFENLD